MDKQTDLISRLQDEADLCRNEGASDIAALLDEAVAAIRDRNHDTQVGAKWREDSRLVEWFPLTAEQLAAKERENLHLAREARTWWEAAHTYAADAERFRWLAEHTVATGLSRWVHPFQFLGEAVDARRKEASAAPRVTTAAELRQQAKSDTSCVGAFARARPGRA